MSTEEHGTGPRSVNLYVTGSAVGVLRVLIMLRSGWLNRSDVMRHAVAGQTELIDRGVPQ